MIDHAELFATLTDAISRPAGDSPSTHLTTTAPHITSMPHAHAHALRLWRMQRVLRTNGQWRAGTEHGVLGYSGGGSGGGWGEVEAGMLELGVDHFLAVTAWRARLNRGGEGAPDRRQEVVLERAKVAAAAVGRGVAGLLATRSLAGAAPPAAGWELSKERAAALAQHAPDLHAML